MIKQLLSLSLLFLMFLLGTGVFAPKADAAALSNLSDTISTSRPSASSPLSADAAANVTQLSIYDNGSRYLASDSGRIVRTSTNLPIGNDFTVASQSAALTTVYLTGTGISAAAQNGTDVLVAPITAMHSISFLVPNAIPNAGDIVIEFPALTSGDANNEASPSATTFQFNNLDADDGTHIQVLDDNVAITPAFDATNPSAGTSPTITITLNDGAIAAGSLVEIFIGCTATGSGTCSTQSPRLINPTQTGTAAGTARTWRVRVTTKDASDVTLDSGSAVVGTIDSVQVLATVDPTLTFTIAGVANATAINTGNATGCTNSETTNTGIAATATTVNLGTLSNTPTAIDTKVGNIAAQLISITTNAQNGYSLTATSGGQLRDVTTGFAITSSTTAAVFPNGTPWFGIHPCGLDVSASTWTETGASQNCSTHITGSSANECKYAWPTQTSATTLASDSSGPIGNSLTAGNGLVSVEYAAGIDASVPAGIYKSVITYVATPTF